MTGDSADPLATFERSEPVADPRLLVVGASALSLVGVALLAGTDGTVPTVMGGFSWVSAGVLAALAWDIKRGDGRGG